MAEIKSGAGSDKWTIDPTSKAGRGTLYSSTGVELLGQHLAAASIPVVLPSDGTLPLPTGAASAANQSTAQTSLSSIDNKLTKVYSSPDNNTRLGVYYYESGAQLVLAAADAATAGRCWLINPVGSAVTMRVRKILFNSQLGSALATPTSPRITFERVTFTGTPSGASIAPAKRKSSDASPVGSLRTASTGLTLTAGAVIGSFLTVACGTAVGFTAPSNDEWDTGSEDYVDLVAGEGIVIRQPDAGTTSDTRRFVVNFIVEEF